MVRRFRRIHYEPLFHLPVEDLAFIKSFFCKEVVFSEAYANGIDLPQRVNLREYVLNSIFRACK